MSDVIPLRPSSEVSEHLDFLYGDTKGYVYAGLKTGDDWRQEFFEWPRQQSDIVKFVAANAGASEVYVAPALFSKPSGQKADVLGTWVYWSEFDGNAPTQEALSDVPTPSRRVRSSENGHEHWYWRLTSFDQDITSIESANRGLTYLLGADTSGWDANQVLRPPDTYNHKRSKPVQTVYKSDTRYNASHFSGFAPPPNLVGDVVKGELPTAIMVLATTGWAEEDVKFFLKKDVPVGERSSAMMRLAFICAEMRLTDNQAYAILLNADDRWKKFAHRPDRLVRMRDLLNKARAKYPLEVMAIDEAFQDFGFEDFLAHDIVVEWCIPGLLQRAGYFLLSGPPGTGKTQLSLRFAINLALGREFLGYSAGDPLKVVFFSMEMGHADLKYFVSQMAVGLSSEDRALLNENLRIIPLGYGVLLDTPKEQQKVIDYVEKFRPDGIFFDSLGSTSTDELSNETTVKKIMDWNDRLRSDYGCFTWYIHHNRKAQGNNKRPDKLADIYGNQYITARATTVLGLWPSGNELVVSALKMRLAPMFAPFNIRRTEGLNFERRSAGAALIAEAMDEPAKPEPTNLNDFLDM